MNIGAKKKEKTLLEINAQLGRNQVIQHCFKVLLTKVFKTKPSKQEFLNYLWESGIELISDLPEYVECEEQSKKTVKPERKETRKKLF